MARPIEHGLIYFPLDTDFDLDDKFQIITAKYGNDGLAILIILLCKIYDNSYFYSFGEKELLLLSKRVNVNINTVSDCINDSIEYGIFSKEKYDKYKILTSNGIQKRYFEAVKRRKEILIIKEYLVNGIINDVNVAKNIVYVNIKTQSKVNKSKANKTEIESKASDIFTFENFWDLYDKKIGDKDKIKKKWDLLSETDRVKIIEHIPKYIKSTPDKKYRKNPETYLNNKSWNDEIIETKNIKPPRATNSTQEFKSVVI